MYVPKLVTVNSSHYLFHLIRNMFIGMFSVLQYFLICLFSQLCYDFFLYIYHLSCGISSTAHVDLSWYCRRCLAHILYLDFGIT